MSTFESTKRSLPDILQDIIRAKIQLPDFQRGWVWDDEHIRSLLVSIARSFPVGAVMLLEAGGEARFQVRPIEGVVLDGTSQAELLVLDGQQRLTALTQVLALKTPVETKDDKDKRIKRHYYWDIQAALEGPEHLEDAIFGVDEDRIKRSNFGRTVDLDLSSVELECKQLYFPCDQILNSDAWEEALQAHAPDQFGLYMRFRKSLLSAFRSYLLPVIQLHRSTSKEAVCLVFEKVNTGGVPLNVFELVTATYAADGYNLRDDWYGSKTRKLAARSKRMIDKERVLRPLESTDFLQAVSMLWTLEMRQGDLTDGKSGKQLTPISAKRSTILEMLLDAYKKWCDRAEQGFMMAAKFLRKECVKDSRDLPYRTQLAPLAAVLAILGERWMEPKIYERLSQWYWCGVLGELYGGAVETRMANDVEDLLGWVEDERRIPRTVQDAAFRPDRLERMTSRLSAAYKGINVLVVREGAQDFFWKLKIQELDDEDIALDIHHIFPQKWCGANDIPRGRCNCIINKTPISYKANRMIGGQAPSDYLGKLQAHKQVQLPAEGMDRILESHRICADDLRCDDFDAFFMSRREGLLELIERAMGKQRVAHADDSPPANDEGEDETDESSSPSVV